MDAHANQYHSGLSNTVTLLRQTFWIPSIRQRVKSVLQKCLICRKCSGQPFKTPEPPPLPKDRVLQSPPFTVTGVDFTGALYVRVNENVEKVYLSLFSCANSRAVHLELVDDLSKENFILAFRRFSSRRSLPKIMISDNGTTFVAASKEIERQSNSFTLQEKLGHLGTIWKFIPKRAPWYGGWWERLIGMTKTCLKRTLGRALVSKTTLQTVIVDIRRILNDRPLTDVSSDVLDEDPITPSHLLQGRKLSPLPYPENNIEDVTTSTMTHVDANKLYRVQVKLLEHFWSRWKREYLTSLREYQRSSGNNDQKLKVGDVVLVCNDHPRNKWLLAIIEKLAVFAPAYI